jgi:hypothetical protein
MRRQPIKLMNAFIVQTAVDERCALARKYRSTIPTRRSCDTIRGARELDVAKAAPTERRRLYNEAYVFSEYHEAHTL